MSLVAGSQAKHQHHADKHQHHDLRRQHCWRGKRPGGLDLYCAKLHLEADIADHGPWTMTARNNGWHGLSSSTIRRHRDHIVVRQSVATIISLLRPRRANVGPALRRGTLGRQGLAGEYGLPGGTEAHEQLT